MTLLCVSCRFFQVVHMPVVCNDRCPGYVPQLQLINKVVSLLPYTWWSMSLLRGCASSTVAVGEETVALPQLQLLRTSPDVVDTPVVAQRQFPMVLRTIEIPKFHFDKVIDVTVVQVVRAPQVRRGGDSRAHVEKLVAGCSSASRGAEVVIF